MRYVHTVREAARLAPPAAQAHSTIVVADLEFEFLITAPAYPFARSLPPHGTALRQRDVAELRPMIDEAAVDGLKFSECLPTNLAKKMLECRLQETEATRKVLEEQIRFVVQS